GVGRLGIGGVGGIAGHEAPPLAPVPGLIPRASRRAAGAAVDLGSAGRFTKRGCSSRQERSKAPQSVPKPNASKGPASARAGGPAAPVAAAGAAASHPAPTRRRRRPVTARRAGRALAGAPAPPPGALPPRPSPLPVR